MVGMKQAQRPFRMVSLAVLMSPMVLGAAPGVDPPAVSGTGAGTGTGGGTGQVKIEEYVRELSKVSARDAEGFYRLGRWCEEHGLADKARKAYERAIRIDPDHAQARAALKYRPEGTGWTQAGGKPAGEVVPKQASSAAPVTASAKTPKGQAPAPASAKEPAGDAGAKAPPAKGETKAGETKAEVTRLDDQVLAKKRWAQEAAQKLEMTFATYEDEDFLIHTTCEAGSPKVKAVVAKLKNLKKLVQGVIGRPKGPLWPGKQHFIFMRESTECMRFAQAIDGQRFPEEIGMYSVEAKWESVSVLKVLESEYPRSNAADDLEAQALTLVQYLYTSNKSGLQEFVQDLKSPEAPVRQGKDDKLFISKYAAYQERSLRSNFHDTMEKLGENWKKYVAARGSELERNQKNDSKTGKTQKTGKTGKQGAGRTKGEGRKPGGE